ncbi:hypothetical protein F0330_24260 [Klebsiella pneumoniae]|nr:hypothetical protein F0330_24260 [Klebsiella pneumoniae]
MMAFSNVHYVSIYQTVTSLTYVFVLLAFRPHHRQGLQCWYALYSSPPGGTIHESWWARNHHTQNVRQHTL